MPERRQLTFGSLDEVISDVDRLLSGHITLGRWSLGQMCYHLARPIRFSVEGPSISSEPTPEQEEARRRFFAAGRFPEGLEAPAFLVPKPDLDDRLEADALREAIDLFVSTDGPFATHPILGPLTKDEWTRFHCMHCAHHLGFALPVEQAPMG
jgi:Protein of unknown function (DUF1569)